MPGRRAWRSDLRRADTDSRRRGACSDGDAEMTIVAAWVPVARAMARTAVVMVMAVTVARLVAMTAVM